MTESAQLALVREYDRTRIEVNAAALFASGSAAFQICRYCGKHWRLWAGSQLDGHAKCLVTARFKSDLAVALKDPTLTYGTIATLLGVTKSVVRAWCFPKRGKS